MPPFRLALMPVRAGVNGLTVPTDPDADYETYWQSPLVVIAIERAEGCGS